PRNLPFNLFFSALKFIFHRAAFQVAPEPGNLTSALAREISRLVRPAKAPQRLIRRAHLIAALALVLPAGACFSFPRIPTTGRLANTAISTTVDSEFARYYLAFLSGQRAGNSSLAERIADIEQSFAKHPLDRVTLREISQETSPDFASIYFVGRCLADHTNE